MGGLEDLLGLAPAARNDVEALVGEDVLLGGGYEGVVQAVCSCCSNGGGIRGVISQAIEV